MKTITPRCKELRIARNRRRIDREWTAKDAQRALEQIKLWPLPSQFNAGMLTQKDLSVNRAFGMSMAGERDKLLNAFGGEQREAPAKDGAKDSKMENPFAPFAEELAEPVRHGWLSIAKAQASKVRMGFAELPNKLSKFFRGL